MNLFKLQKPDQLKSLMMDAIKNGLEGLVIKDTQVNLNRLKI